jgi:excisionase family DNA binding protein
MIARDFDLPSQPPSESDVRLARDSYRRLRHVVGASTDPTAGRRSIRFVGPDGSDTTIDIPASAAELLMRALSEMAEGNAVTLIPIRSELTTQQAADILGVSRPFVVKEIEERRLPARRVGTRRRVMLTDLMTYKQRSDASRQQALDALAELDENLGLR